MPEEDRNGPQRQPGSDLEEEINKIMYKTNAPKARTIAGATAGTLSMALSELTRELPKQLQRYNRDELVNRILEAEHALSENGEFIAWLDGQWFYANPDKLEQFLLQHNGRAFHFEGIGVIKARVMSERRQAESRGFDVSRLDNALDMGDEEAEKELSSYLDDWGRAEDVLRQLNDMDARGFEQEVEVLSAWIKAFKGLGDAKTAMVLLEKKVAQRRREVAPILPKLERDIDALQAEGYIVIELRRLLATGDVPAIEKAIQDFENDIDRLKELDKRGHRLRQQGFDVEIDLIKHHFSDPAKIPLIENEIKALEEEIRKEEERQGTISDIEAKVGAWEREGFDTTILRTSFTKDPTTIAESVENFGKAAERLQKMRRILDSMRGQGIDREVEKVKRLTGNVENIGKVGQAINFLREMIAENDALEQEKRALREKVDAWAADGWKVDALLPLFDGDIEQLKAGLTEFEDSRQFLESQLAILGSMDIKGFEKEAGIIQKMAKNPKNMDKVRDAIETLAQAIEEGKEARQPRMPQQLASEEIKGMIVALPRGLPSTLWGRTPDELAEAIAKGPFGNTPEKKVVVRLARRWYLYEPDEPDTLLQPFEGDVELLEPGGWRE